MLKCSNTFKWMLEFLFEQYDEVICANETTNKTRCD